MRFFYVFEINASKNRKNDWICLSIRTKPKKTKNQKPKKMDTTKIFYLPKPTLQRSYATVLIDDDLETFKDTFKEMFNETFKDTFKERSRNVQGSRFDRTPLEPTRAD